MDMRRIMDTPGMQYFWQVDNLYLAGQPAPESFDTFKEMGFKAIINLRDPAEGDFSFEERLCTELGVDYHHFPIMVDGMLNKDACEKLNGLVNTTDKFLIHCASANRVGGWLITYLVKERGMDFEGAIDVASQSGLSNPGFIAQAEALLA